MDGLQTCGDDNACKMFMESVRGKKFLFALTISHTETCTIPGITIAGATPELAKYTPAADACGKCTQPKNTVHAYGSATRKKHPKRIRLGN